MLAPPLLTALFGVVVRELVSRALGAYGARRIPLRRRFWRVNYSSADDGSGLPESIELVMVSRRGRKVSGRIYRIYREHHGYCWAFEGHLLQGGQLSVIYRSVGKEEIASNGIMILGPLTRDLLCGIFHETPTPEREAELNRMDDRVVVVKRIGAKVQEEAQVELIAVGDELDDPVRGFLAAIPPDDPSSPERILSKLPRRVQRVLLRPASPSRTLRLVWAMTRVVPVPLGALRRLSAKGQIEPAAWRSPSRAILYGDRDRDEAA
jgi:hypothetical protein